jgi:NSS family neurotransmitter:Na+ symporter
MTRIIEIEVLFNMDGKKKRSSFSSRVGFVMAAASSAVGLGNLWRFPYLAARYGGGIFLLCYVILAATFGFAMLTAEIGVGRYTKLSAAAAYKSLDRRFSICGWLGLIIPAIITPYYCVIGGWVVKYITIYLRGMDKQAAADGFFANVVSAPVDPIVWFLVFLGFTFVVVLLGVEQGIEKISKILMPILLLLSLGIAIYSITRPGALGGVKYYLLPDFSKFSGKTVLGALGQLFYSLSIAMGIMVTYGSYMRKEDNMESSVIQIEIFDSLVAFIAGLMIVPAVYVFSGGDESAMNQGTGLMFITLPKVFNSFAGGRIVGLAFFILVFFAAVTSSISLLEAIVSNVMDLTKWKRRKTTIIMTIYCALVGIPCSLGFGPWSTVKILGYDILDFLDFLSNSIMMPVLAFLTCIFVGYFLKPKTIIDEAEIGGQTFHGKKYFTFMIKYVAPIGILIILATDILSTLGILSI